MIVLCRLAGAHNPIVQQYALPDYTSGNMRGRVLSRDEMPAIQAGGQSQVLTLNAERYAIPEILFHPFDVGGSMYPAREEDASLIRPTIHHQGYSKWVWQILSHM